MWFKVRALSADDMITHVTLPAIGETEARRQLDAYGLRPLSVGTSRQVRPRPGSIAHWMGRFAKVFEPALMTAIGIVVGAIVVLLYLPIFDLAGSLS